MSDSARPSPLGLLRVVPALAVDVARSTVRMLFRRVQRVRAVVNAEYDAGRWSEVQRSAAWSRGDLRAFLQGDDQSRRLAKIDGRIVSISMHDYYGRRIAALQRLIGSEAGEAVDLVELGCGYGYNLFSLSLDPRWRTLLGFDISDTGLAAGRSIAQHFGLASRIFFDHLDITDAEQAAFERIRGQTVFTYFCIEQIPYAVEKVVENLLRHRPKRVIHVEPTTERLRLWRLGDLANYVYVKSVDYQTQLFTVVEDLARQGRVRIVSDCRSDFAPTIHNDGFILTWEPV